MSAQDYRQDVARWDALLERQAVGDTLSEADQSFMDAFADAHPECARELQLMQALSDLDAAPDADSGALVDSVMRALTESTDSADDGEDGEPEALSISPPAARRSVLWMAAAAVAALGLWTQLMPAPAARQARNSTRNDSRMDATLDMDMPMPPASARLELVYSSGDARIDGRPAAAGPTLLREGETVATGAGTACFVLDPGIDVCLEGHSRLRVAALAAPERRLQLLSGQVALRLDKQPAGNSVTIDAGGITSTAIGTAFSVRHDGSGVATSVMEGRVRVHDGARSHMVGAHQRVAVDTARNAELSALSRSDEAPAWGALSGRALWQGEVSGDLHVTGPAGATVWLDGRTVGSLPLSSLVPVGSHMLVVKHAGQVVHELHFEARAGQREEVVVRAPAATAGRQAGAEPGSSGARGAAPRPPKRSAAELLSGARHMMVEGRWADAADIYRALRRRHPDSPEARTVQVSLAQLELDRLGRPAEALALIDHYLGSGETVLQEEARYTRIRALRRLGLPSAELDAIGVFLAAHPRSFHLRQLTRRRQTLQAAAR